MGRILTLLLVAWALLLAARGMVKALRLIYAAAWELGRPVFHDTTKAAFVFLGLTTAASTATGLARQTREGADAAGWVVTVPPVFAVYLATWLVACLFSSLTRRVRRGSRCCRAPCCSPSARRSSISSS